MGSGSGIAAEAVCSNMDDLCIYSCLCFIIVIRGSWPEQLLTRGEHEMNSVVMTVVLVVPIIFGTQLATTSDPG